MNLNKIVGIDLKRFLSIDFKDVKGKLLFKTGEVLKGEVLQRLENSFLVDLGDKGIVKAWSDVNITDKNVFLKVVQTNPEVVLKLLGKAEQNVNLFLKNFNLFDIKAFLEEFPELMEKLEITAKDFAVHSEADNLPKNIKEFSDKSGLIFEKELHENSEQKKHFEITEKDFTNNSKTNLLAKKIKELPDKLGLTFEKALHQGKINKDSVKYKVLDSIKSNIESTTHKNILQFIEHNQTLNNNSQLFFPLFFKDLEIDKGYILFKKVNKQDSKDKSFNIVILLDLTENRVLQINILSVNKNLNLTFIANKENFLKELKGDIAELDSNLKAFDFNIISVSFKHVDKLDNNNELKNFFSEPDNINIIDIKT